MVDPKNLLVWHSDYVDHVDEEQLSGSFENFLQKIDFKILGVTKDKWKAATNAFKTVFHGTLDDDAFSRHWFRENGFNPVTYNEKIT